MSENVIRKVWYKSSYQQRWLDLLEATKRKWEEEGFSPDEDNIHEQEAHKQEDGSLLLSQFVSGWGRISLRIPKDCWGEKPT